MNKFIGWAVLAIVIVGGIWYFTSGSNQQATETGPIKIGVSLPLAGEAAAYGEWMQAGLELALMEINDSGGINGREVRLIYEDDGCSPDGVNVFTKFTSIDNVDAILGPLCSAAAGPGLPIAQNAKVPTIFWGSAPDLPKLGDYLFRTYPSDAYQGKFAAEYAYNMLGARNAAVIYVQNDWGAGLHDTFVAEFKRLGGTVVAEEGIAQDTTDTRTSVTKVKSTNPDFIFAPLYPASAIFVLKDISFLGLDATIMGGDGTASPEVIALPEAEGMLIEQGVVGNPEEFKNRLMEKVGVESGTWTPLAYDALKIMAGAMERAGTDPQKLRDELARLDYKEGISYPDISFDGDGDLVSATFEIQEISGGEMKPYTP